MNSHHMLRSLFSAALLTMAAAPSVRAEGTFDIPPGAHFNPQKLERVGDYLRDQAATGNQESQYKSQAQRVVDGADEKHDPGDAPRDA